MACLSLGSLSERQCQAPLLLATRRLPSQPSALHSSSSFPISLSQALSTASPSTSPQPATAVLASSSHPSSFPIAPSRVRSRPRTSRPYQSLLKSASAEEASTSDDDSVWHLAVVQSTSQADLPPYALMHGSTYMPQTAYSVQQQQPQSSLLNGSSSAHSSPLASATLQPNPLPPQSQTTPAPFPATLERPYYPQSRSRSNSFTNSSPVASSAQPTASMSSPNQTIHTFTAARGNSTEPSAVSALLHSARSLMGSLGISRSPNASPSVTYSYQPVILSSVSRPSTASPSASPLTLSHYSSAYPPPPLPSGTHSLLPPIHDDDDTPDSDDDGELRVLTGEDSDWSSDEVEDDSPTTARHDKYGPTTSTQRPRHPTAVPVHPPRACSSSRRCARSSALQRCWGLVHGRVLLCGIARLVAVHSAVRVVDQESDEPLQGAAVVDAREAHVRIVLHARHHTVSFLVRVVHDC